MQTFRISVVFILFIQIVFFEQAVYAAVSALDAEENQITLQKPAQRIISLAPHITEMLFAAGAGDKIVGTVSYSDFPEQAKSIPLIGSYNRFDLEKILALQPQLIVNWASGNPKQSLAKLKQQGIPLFISEPRTIEDIFYEIQALAKLTDTNVIANKNLQNYKKHYQRLKTKYQTNKKLTVFYQVWDRPLMTVNGQHLISQVIELCGGKNVFHAIETLVPQVDMEAVLLTNPQIILTSTKPGQDENWKKLWTRWQHLPAVKNQQLFAIPGDLISRHTPRILQGAEIICQHIYRARSIYR